MKTITCVELTRVTQVFSLLFRDSGPASIRLHSGLVCGILRVGRPMTLICIMLPQFLFWHFKTCSCKNTLKICVPL